MHKVSMVLTTENHMERPPAFDAQRTRELLLDFSKFVILMSLLNKQGIGLEELGI